MTIEFPVKPMGKPRMTQRDKWMKRHCTTQYWSFKDSILNIAKKIGFTMPESGYHLKFFIPIPKSWSKKEKAAMLGKPHQQKPDKDNLEKAFLDALCKDDSHIWDGRVSKYWGDVGKIIIEVDDVMEVIK